MDDFRFGVLILAAGASRRMGRPKMLLPWGETTVLGHLWRQWSRIGSAQIAVVCASGAEELTRELDRLEIAARNRIVNSTPERGMFSSIQTAAAWPGWVSGLTHHVIVLGDQPHLLDSTLTALITFSGRHPALICQPARSGNPRHPVVLPQRLFLELQQTGARDLKEFLRAHEENRQLVEISDQGLDFDMDTPDDYERLRPV